MNSQIKITNWPQYVAAAISTESKLQAINPGDIRLSHALFGLVTELKEYLDGQGKVNNIEELGDVLWYLAVADDVVDFSTDSTTLLTEYPNDPWLIVADIADCLKRGIFYGKGYDFERLKNALRQMRAWVYDQIPDVVGVEEVVTANIIKLAKRYPDKVFSAIHAHTRDVDRELEHISETGKVLTGEVEIKPYTLELGEPMDKETIMETFFPLNTVQLSYQGFNEVVRKLLTLGQIEKMAMDLAFIRAQQYRKMGAMELARGYDAMYKSYSGKGDRLEDYSLAIMWQEAGYSLDEEQVKERLERWK